MNNLVKVENDQFLVDDSYIEKYKLFLELKEWIELADKQIKQDAKDFMEATGKPNMTAGNLYFEYRKPTTRTSIDTKKLKEELPDIWEEYSKSSPVASSVIVKVLS